MKTAYIYHPLFLRHDTGQNHPENSERLTTAHRLLSQQDWFKSLVDTQHNIVDERWLSTTHEADYIDRVAMHCRNGERRVDNPDVSISEASYEVALNAVGSVLQIADDVVSGTVDNGFAMVRPLGHHAEKAEAMGFCLFNHIAITAKYLQQQHNLERILIMDWDVHHGNGTQHIFEDDPSVFYISLHQFPHYPGTGAIGEAGIGAGMGTTLNCPMSAGLGDEAYKHAFEEIILPKARAFRPDAVLISAGFDAHQSDPLGNINLNDESYIWMTQKMMDLADSYSNGRLISVLEGGYNLDALARCVVAHVKTLSQH